MNEPAPLTVPTEMAERLKALGWDPDAPRVITPVPTEDADDLAHRRATLLEVYRTRWDTRLPVMFRDAALADLTDHDAFHTMSAWASNPGSLTLVLAGQVGTGKTHAAYAIGNDLVGRGTWVECYTVADLLDTLRPGGDAKVGVDVRRCDVLVLDDLMAGDRVTEFASEALTQIVDDRLRNRRRQIITTNAPYPALEEAWGARLLDRLRYRWTVVEMVGKSRRAAAW